MEKQTATLDIRFAPPRTLTLECGLQIAEYSPIVALDIPSGMPSNTHIKAFNLSIESPHKVPATDAVRILQSGDFPNGITNSHLRKRFQLYHDACLVIDPGDRIQRTLVGGLMLFPLDTNGGAGLGMDLVLSPIRALRLMDLQTRHASMFYFKQLNVLGQQAVNLKKQVYEEGDAKHMAKDDIRTKLIERTTQLRNEAVVLWRSLELLAPAHLSESIDPLGSLPRDLMENVLSMVASATSSDWPKRLRLVNKAMAVAAHSRVPKIKVAIVGIPERPLRSTNARVAAWNRANYSPPKRAPLIDVVVKNRTFELSVEVTNLSPNIQWARHLRGPMSLEVEVEEAHYDGCGRVHHSFVSSPVCAAANATLRSTLGDLVMQSARGTLYVSVALLSNDLMKTFQRYGPRVSDVKRVSHFTGRMRLVVRPNLQSGWLYWHDTSPMVVRSLTASTEPFSCISRMPRSIKGSGTHGRHRGEMVLSNKRSRVPV